ncbi:hypothetical protein HanPSC8_Chr17g0780351 [Helianthus annuus]|nr:hypothetical protein HanPSC8_Chr17g0780351 [Helianthus annuus]
MIRTILKINHHHYCCRELTSLARLPENSDPSQTTPVLLEKNGSFQNFETSELSQRVLKPKERKDLHMKNSPKKKELRL